MPTQKSGGRRRELRQLLARFPEWRVAKITGSGHLKLVKDSTGEFWFTASTPSDWRGVKKLRSDLRRKAKSYE